MAHAVSGSLHVPLPSRLNGYSRFRRRAGLPVACQAGTTAWHRKTTRNRQRRTPSCPALSFPQTCCSAVRAPHGHRSAARPGEEGLGRTRPPSGYETIHQQLMCAVALIITLTVLLLKPVGLRKRIREPRCSRPPGRQGWYSEEARRRTEDDFGGILTHCIVRTRECPSPCGAATAATA